MKWTAIAACLMLAGCAGSGSQMGASTPSSTKALPPVDLTADQRADVEKGIRKNLKDPNSAMFGNMNAGISDKSPDTYIVCGWVNSKNSYGGYVGDKPFLAMYFPKLKTAALIGMGGTSTDTYVVRQQCINEGVPLGV